MGWVKMFPVNSPVTFGYGVKYSRFKGTHKGVDFAVKTGTPVYACVSGAVVHAGTQGRGVARGWGKAFGIHIIIDNAKFADGSPGLWAGYMHLSKVNVRAGQKIKKGQLIGWTGNTGRSTGPHLHLEIQQGRYWSPTKHVNPKRWLKA